MHASDFTRRYVGFENRKSRTWRWPKWMKSWQENPISYETKRLIKSILQWMLRCLGLKRLQQLNEGNFRGTWMEPNKRQRNGHMLIGRGQTSDWSMKSIKWHWLNPSFLMDYSNIMSDNHCKNSGLIQPVLDAHSPRKFLNWRMLQKEKMRGQYTLATTSMWNLRSVYPMLRLNQPPGVSLISIAL